eukprot:318925-Amphidinium_carterae.1
MSPSRKTNRGGNNTPRHALCLKLGQNTHTHTAPHRELLDLFIRIRVPSQEKANAGTKFRDVRPGSNELPSFSLVVVGSGASHAMRPIGMISASLPASQLLTLRPFPW